MFFFKRKIKRTVSNGKTPLDDSLSALNPNDIPEKCKPEKRKTDYFNTVLLTVSAIIFIFSSAALIKRTFDYKEADDIYDDARNIFYEDEQIDTSLRVASVMPLSKSKEIRSSTDLLSSIGEIELDTSYEESVDTSELDIIRQKLEKLQAINKDVMGWIKIDGTRVDYPILIGNDNDYYLTHTYNKKYLSSGSIFADFRCSKSVIDNKNLILYGHHMSDGSMFKTLLNFKNDKAVFNNSLIKIYTKDGIYIYKPFSVYTTHIDFYYIQTYFQTDDDFMSLVNEMKSKTLIRNIIGVNASDNIITLSTCTNIDDNYRYVVNGVLVEVIR